MSSINTLSVFYFGTTITIDNKYLNFDEGLGELAAEIPVNDYSLEEFAAIIAESMTLTGTQTYTCTVDRDTRKLTISAPANFTIMTGTGSQIGSSPFTLMGFTQVTDYTGSNSYEGDVGAGFEYRPQLTLNQYIQPEDYEVKESAVVNMSANGVVQTLQFGDGQRMECNIRGASNVLNIKTSPFFENATGIQALRDFMKFLITKSKIEFMPDVDTRGTFYKLLLESTEGDRSGTKFIIRNMEGSNNFYETGKLMFRKVIE